MIPVMQMVLAILALIFAAISPTGYVPLWISVVLLAILALLQYFPK